MKDSMTIDSDYVVKVQAILGLTNYEFSFVLGVSEKSVESWRGGWQVPSGASAELIRLFGLIAERGK